MARGGSSSRAIIWTAATAALVLLLAGCGVQRTMTLLSEPPGALVYLNGQEVGRTPVTRDFTWYGNYDVVLRKEGYETLQTSTPVNPPVWQWIPFDLFAELMPFRPHDEQYFAYILTPATTQPADPQAIIDRAGELQAQLQSGRYTRTPAPPATQPATAPARQP